MRIILVCIFALFITAHVFYAQDSTKAKTIKIDKVAGDTTYTESITISKTENITPRNNALIINPLKFFIFYNLTYYHTVNPNLAFGVGVQVPTFKGIDGIGINGELRFHPGGKSLRGFYAAPNFSYNYLKTGDVETEPFSIGLLFGWQWFPGDDFAIGFGLGIDYYIGTISDNDDLFSDYSGIVPALRFDIGYAW